MYMYKQAITHPPVTVRFLILPCAPCTYAALDHHGIVQGRLTVTEENQATSEQELELELERSRLLNEEIARLKREVEQSRSGNLAAPDAARVAELEALLSQARADVAKFQALAEKNATAYQNAMARLFPAITSLSAR